MSLKDQIKEAFDSLEKGKSKSESGYKELQTHAGPIRLTDEINLSTIEPSQESPNSDFSVKDELANNHDEGYDKLLKQLYPVNFKNEANLKDTERLEHKHTQIIVVQKVLESAAKFNWSLCSNNGFLYLYNGEYWQEQSKENLEAFLGRAAEKMGVDFYNANYYAYREKLTKQFMSQANLPKPAKNSSKVLINLKNGTFEISAKSRELRSFCKNDFLTYQLDFEFKPDAQCPMFKAFLNRVLPDVKIQMVLAEFVGSVFISTSVLKLEKALLLYGDGANGKSVFYEIINKLLGPDNISSYSLGSLMDSKGYHRSELGTKLLNYSSEISGNIESGSFKQLTSGEPIEARPIYGKPLILTDYAKLMFNCNTLPQGVEHTNAFYRRFVIAPFGVTIPDHEQDKELSQKIINSELSGIFNWVLEGLTRLLINKKLTPSEAIDNQLLKYKTETDTVKLFLDENNYQPGTKSCTVKDLSIEYGMFCEEFRYPAVNHGVFANQLRKHDFLVKKSRLGLVVFIEKSPLEHDDNQMPESPNLLLPAEGLETNTFPLLPIESEESKNSEDIEIILPPLPPLDLF